MKKIILVVLFSSVYSIISALGPTCTGASKILHDSYAKICSNNISCHAYMGKFLISPHVNQCKEKMDLSSVEKIAKELVAACPRGCPKSMGKDMCINSCNALGSEYENYLIRTLKLPIRPGQTKCKPACKAPAMCMVTPTGGFSCQTQKPALPTLPFVPKVPTKKSVPPKTALPTFPSGTVLYQFKMHNEHKQPLLVTINPISSVPAALSYTIAPREQVEFNWLAEKPGQLKALPVSQRGGVAANGKTNRTATTQLRGAALADNNVKKDQPQIQTISIISPGERITDLVYINNEAPKQQCQKNKKVYTVYGPPGLVKYWGIKRASKITPGRYFIPNYTQTTGTETEAKIKSKTCT